jgi:hypothetical protein
VLPDNLVCVVAEANAWPYSSGPDPARSSRDELVHLVAERIATGERFEAIARPEGALSPSTTFHIGLSEDLLRAGMPRGELIAAFERFVQPADIVAAWGHYGLDLVATSGAALPARVDLRAFVQRALHRKIGSLEDHAGLEDRPGPRAQRRLAMLVAVVRRHLA